MGNCFGRSTATYPYKNLREDNSAGETTRLLSTVQQEISKPWYHGQISKEEAEYRLESVTKGLRAKGTFLVYSDSSGYVLLVFKNGQHRCRIQDRGGSEFVLVVDECEQTATLNPQSHGSVIKLVKYHKGLSGKPIKLRGDESVRLRDYATVP